MLPKLLSLKEVAAFFRKTEQTIRLWEQGFYWVNGKRVPYRFKFPKAVRIAGDLFFKEFEVLHFAQSGGK